MLFTRARTVLAHSSQHLAMVLFGSVRPLYVWLGGGAATAVIVTAVVVLCVILVPTPAPIVNLLDLDAKQRREYLRSFDLVLSDCDGTVWDLNRTPAGVGAGAGVSALQTVAAKRVVFVTNNAMLSDDGYLERFRHEAVNATMADVMHPGVAFVEYFRQQNFDGLIYLMGTENVRRYLVGAGYRLVDAASAKRPIGEAFGPLQGYAQDGLPVDAVVMDVDPELQMKELIRAEAYLVARPECHFLVGARDEKLEQPMSVMGPGVLVRMLEQLVDRKAKVLGMPGDELVRIVMEKYAVKEPRRILIVGDTLSQGIAFGKKAGFQTLAVLTGSATLESIRAAIPEETPDYYLPSFGDFVELCKDA